MLMIQEEKMKFEAISISYKVAKKKLFERFKGRVFHVTSPDNFIKICTQGSILNNKNKTFKPNWGDSYFTSKGCVSVCDLLNNNGPVVTKRAMNQYDVFRQPWGATSVFLFLSPESYSNLITWHHWKKEGAPGAIVPHLESGFPEAIPLTVINEVWFVTVTDWLAFFGKSRIN